MGRAMTVGPPPRMTAAVGRLSTSAALRGPSCNSVDDAPRATARWQRQSPPPLAWLEVATAARAAKGPRARERGLPQSLGEPFLVATAAWRELQWVLACRQRRITRRSRATRSPGWREGWLWGGVVGGLKEAYGADGYGGLGERALPLVDVNVRRVTSRARSPPRPLGTRQARSPLSQWRQLPGARIR